MSDRVASLRERLSAALAARPGWIAIPVDRGDLCELVALLDADARDAARLDWLLTHSCMATYRPPMMSQPLDYLFERREQVDAAVVDSVAEPSG